MQPSRVPLVYFQAWICDPMHPRRVAGLQDSRATDVPAIYGARQSGHVRATRSPFTAPGSAASVGRGRSVGGVLMSPALPSRQRHCAKPPTSGSSLRLPLRATGYSTAHGTDGDCRNCASATHGTDGSGYKVVGC
jgi:hypothetical protein